jgi:hypothetical protein
MIPVYKVWLMGVLAVLLAGCINLPKPETLAQQIAYADATLTGLINAAATATEIGKLTPNQAIRFRTRAKDADAALEAAKRFSGLDKPDDAAGQLALAREVLLELNRWLVELETRQ